MKIVDANVLLYAVNTTSEHHKPSLRWLDGALSGADRVGFAWVPLLAFVRLATKVGLFPRPLPREAAITQVADWLAAPSAVLVNPTVRHADILARMLTYVGNRCQPGQRRASGRACRRASRQHRVLRQ